MTYELCDAADLDDKLRRSLEQKASGLESRGFELYAGLQQRDAIIGLSQILEEGIEILGPDVQRARTDMSKVKLPMGPSLDSRHGRIEKGLDQTTDPEFLDLIYQVAKAFGGREYHKPSYLWLNKASNIGHPYYDSSSVHRIESVVTGLQAYSKGEGLTLQAFGGFRKQPDSASRNSSGEWEAKKRDFCFPKDMWDTVFPLLRDPTIYSIEEKDGFVYGKTPIFADAPFAGPARVRTVKAISYVDNSFPMLLRQTVCDPGQVSEFIWKHRGVEDVFMKAKGKYVYCTDFSNFDQTVLDEEMAEILRAFKENWPDLAGALDYMWYSLRNMEFTSVDLLRPPLTATRHHLFYKSTAGDGSIHGIPSGWGITDVIGKVIGTAFGWWTLRRVGYSLPDWASLEAFKGVLNSGDDLALLTPEDKSEAITAFIQEQKSKAVRKEDEAKFLGNIFDVDQQGRVIGHRPSTLSFIINSMCPERQAGTGMRPYPEYGLSERMTNIRPYLTEERELKYIAKFYAHLTSMIPDFDKLVEEQSEMAHQASDLQALFEKYGLTKFEELFYKLSIKDLPREDAALIGVLVPSQEVVRCLPEIGPYMEH